MLLKHQQVIFKILLILVIKYCSVFSLLVLYIVFKTTRILLDLTFD